MRKLRNLFWNIRRGIANVWYYLPIIWDNNPWDHGYCLELYKASLERLYKQLLKDNYVVRDKHELRKLASLINLLDRHAKDEFPDKELELLEIKYGIDPNAKMVFEPIPGKPDLFEWKSQARIQLSDSQYERYVKEMKAIWKKNNTRKVDEFKLALKLIERNSFRWWS